MFVQENLLELVMFVQVKLLVLVMFFQVIPLVLSMFIQQNLLVLVIFVQTKTICRNNVRPSKRTCRNNVCQSKPTNVNILPCKPVFTGHIYCVSSSILSQQLFFIFFFSILVFSVYYKFSIITINIFINLVLAIVTLLSKLTCLREFFTIFILQNCTFLRSSLNTYITFQSCRTMLLLKTSEVSLFTNCIYAFAVHY